MKKFTNSLINETSPYLLQHAHNPVDWHPWGNEALDKAIKEDKPILVSIGYAACHWCHVMERESFESEETARIMNENFINIKIDREERPDIDHIYMDAVQAMTGSGGWPLNVFLLPDKRPFYGGTYFPPVRAYNRSSWGEILQAVIHAFKNNRNQLENQAFSLTQHLQKSNLLIGTTEADSHLFTKESADVITAKILDNADKEWGGFGQAPKFPQTFSLQYLLRNYYYTGNPESLKHVHLSLNKMIYGGLYDQLSGGFARYSTDEKWFAPHFEKMLYDNALLIGLLSETYQLTRERLYLEVIEETFLWLSRELTDSEGAFYSAIDADSDGEEGKYYTWTKSEIEQVLKEDAELFVQYYGITENGNWEETNILWVKTPLEEFANQVGQSVDKLRSILKKCRKQLLAFRNLRNKPLLDDKIILGWNALMNIACCKAYAATGVDLYKEMAEKNIVCLEKYFQDSISGLWYHTFKNTIARYPAFLDDYAYLISAYIHLQEVTGNSAYLLKAKKLTEKLFENFDDPVSEFFYYTNDVQDDLIVRKKEIYDGATPSANAVMAANLYYLSVIFDIKSWKNRSLAMLKGISSVMKQYPNSFGYWANQYQDVIYQIPEIVVTGTEANRYLKKIIGEYIPSRILLSSASIDQNFPLLEGKDFYSEINYYVCQNNVCAQPVNDLSDLKRLLK